MADGSDWFEENFSSARVMAILRGFGVQKTLDLATVAWDLGLGWVEVPIQSPGDLEALAAIAEAGRARGKQVGAGTVVSAEHVRQAAEAGAVFTVSPGFDPDVVRASLDAGLPTLPGVATASDIQGAQRLGLTWLKAFPASVLGPDWLRAMMGLFPGIRFVATGGIAADNAAQFLDAGARVVAVGSALADEAQLPLLAELTRR